MQYEVLKADEAEDKYLQAKSQEDDSIILVLSSEFIEGAIISSDDLIEQIVNHLDCDIKVHRNIHLPYLHNIIPFLDFVAKRLQEEEFALLKGNTFLKSDVIDILHNYIMNLEKPVERYVIGEDGIGKTINTYEKYNCDELDEFLGDLDNYKFIEVRDGYGYSSNRNEVNSFVKISILESLMGEFFPVVASANIKWHRSAVNRIIKDLEKSKDYNREVMQNLFEKLVPKHGKASTKAGEFIRALGKIEYHLYNDGDYPANYNGRKSVYWAIINCFYSVISDNKAYDILREVLPEFYKQLPRLFLDNCMESDIFIVLSLFAVKYAETEEGNKENDKDFTEPFYEKLEYYSDWAPDFEKQY